MLSHKKSLDILRKTNALLEGHFVLSSGLHSSKYIQCAKLLSFPHKAEKICKSLAGKIKKKFKNFDLILSPAMGGIIIGYEIGRILKKETIFCERVRGKFTLRRGFKIRKGSKVLIIEDIMDKTKDNLGDLKVSKDEIIENVAEKILTQEKSVAVVDNNNNIIGSINPAKIINTVFGGRKNNI